MCDSSTGAIVKRRGDSRPAPRRRPAGRSPTASSYIKIDGRNRWESVLADKRALGDHRPMQPAREPRQIAIVAYPDVQSLDIVGPLEVFAGAQRLIEAT